MKLQRFCSILYDPTNWFLNHCKQRFGSFWLFGFQKCRDFVWFWLTFSQWLSKSYFILQNVSRFKLLIVLLVLLAFLRTNGKSNVSLSQQAIDDPKPKVCLSTKWKVIRIIAQSWVNLTFLQDVLNKLAAKWRTIQRIIQSRIFEYKTQVKH